MNFPRRLTTFLCGGKGVVRVDWVVLTIAVVGIIIALLSMVPSDPSEPGSAGMNHLAASNPTFP